MKTERMSPFGLRTAWTLALLAITPAMAQLAPTPDAQKPAEAPPAKMPAAATTKSASDGTVVLSPFTVTTERDTGYYAENTLSGSRINTRLSDLAASITVVSRQQIEDTASIDLNDIFKYEASTEGSSTYSPSVVDRGTVKDTIAGYTFGNDGSTTTNAQSNRVRGIAAPDAGINNFPVSNRIPMDAYNVQSIEISRGPNSLLFGLGTPAGIVNQNVMQATFDKARQRVGLRVDDNGSFRTDVSFNQPLGDKLAIAGALLYDDRQFVRKPSSDVYRRQYGTLTFKPFPKTVIRGFVEGYNNHANRPNFFTPRDWVSPWIAGGRPAYDPVTRMVTVQDTGRVVGPFLTSNQSPGFISNAVTPVGHGQLATRTSPYFVPGIFFDSTNLGMRTIDTAGNTIGFFQRNPTATYRQGDTNPAVNNTPATWGFVPQDPRYMITDRGWTSSQAFPAPQPTINGVLGTYSSWQNPGVTDKSIYDWTETSLLRPNFSDTKATTYSVELEQEIARNLFFNAGWLRQDIDEWSNYTISQLQGATIAIDTNRNNVDGSSNPYFGLPFIYEGEGGGLDTYHMPERADHYRATLTYDLDLRDKSGWLRWLGRQRLLGLWSGAETERNAERWRMTYTDGDALSHALYVSNLAVPGTRQALSTATMRHYYLANPGDPLGTVSSAPGPYGNQGWQSPYTSNIRVYNAANNTFESHPLTEQTMFTSAGANQGRSQRELKSYQFALQSYLWQDRLVTTLGWRHDDYRARLSTDGAIFNADGTVAAPVMTNAERFVNGINGAESLDNFLNRMQRWDELSGDTRTLGVALRPLQGFKFLDRVGGSDSVAREFLDGLTFYYNQSENFNPPTTFQTDFFRQQLPKPTGEGKDIGIGFHLFKEKLVARISWYETKSLNERTNAASTLINRTNYPDTTMGLAWASSVLRLRKGMASGMTLDQIIQLNNGNWNTDTVIDVSSETDQRKLYEMIELPYLYYSGLNPGGTQQSESRGMEAQVTYNPTRNWTMKLTASKNETIYNDVVPQYDAWIAERMPHWTTIGASDIPDFTGTDGRRWSLKNFWQGYGYSGNAQIENTNGNTNTAAYYENSVNSLVALAKALEGAVAPSQRKYAVSFLTNYNINGDMFGGKLKGFSVGGSARWASEAAIGYYGKVGDPTQPTVVNISDVTRPIYDDGIFNSDIWIAYTTRIYHDRVGMKIQLNCNNWTENGHLMTTQVNFDGSPWAYRIIDPRQFILQTTFSF